MSNRFSYIKLYVADHVKVANFYRDVLGMTASDTVVDGEGEDKHEESILTFGNGVGAELIVVQEYHRPAPAPGEVTPVYWVEDADAIAKAAVEHGGSVHTAPFDDLRFDTRVAYLKDPEGRRFQLMQRIEGEAPPRSLSYIKLYVANHAKLANFYANVLGMKASDTVVDGEGDDEHEESILSLNGGAELIVVQEYRRPAPAAGEVTTWFWVDDAHAVAKAVVENGGTIAIPVFDDVRFGVLTAYFKDPEGRRFQIAQRYAPA